MLVRSRHILSCCCVLLALAGFVLVPSTPPRGAGGTSAAGGQQEDPQQRKRKQPQGGYRVEFDTSLIRPTVFAPLSNPVEGLLLYPRHVDQLYSVLCFECDEFLLEKHIAALAEECLDRRTCAVVIGVESSKTYGRVEHVVQQMLQGSWKRGGGVSLCPFTYLSSPLRRVAVGHATNLDFVDRRFSYSEVRLVNVNESGSTIHSPLIQGQQAGRAFSRSVLAIRGGKEGHHTSLDQSGATWQVEAAAGTSPIPLSALSVVVIAGGHPMCTIDTALSVLTYEPQAVVTVLLRQGNASPSSAIASDIREFKALCIRLIPSALLPQIDVSPLSDVLLVRNSSIAIDTDADRLVEVVSASIGKQCLWTLAPCTTLVISDANIMLRQSSPPLVVRLASGGGATTLAAWRHQKAVTRLSPEIVNDDDKVRHFLRRTLRSQVIFLADANTVHPMHPSRQVPRFERLNDVARRMLAPQAKEKQWCNPLSLQGCAPYPSSSWTGTCMRRGPPQRLRLKSWTAPRRDLLPPAAPRHFPVLISMLSSVHAPFIVMDNVHAWLHFCPEKCGIVVDSVAGMAQDVWVLLHEARLLERVLVNGDVWVELPITGQVGQRHLRNARYARRSGWTFDRFIFTALNELPFRSGFDSYVLSHDGFDPQSSRSAAAEAMDEDRHWEDPASLGASPRAVSASFAMLHVPLPAAIGGAKASTSNDAFPYNQQHLWCLAAVSNLTFLQGLPVGTSTIAFEGTWVTASDIDAYLATTNLDVMWSYDSANEHYALLSVLLGAKLRRPQARLGANINIYAVHDSGVPSLKNAMRMIRDHQEFKFTFKRVSRTRYYGGIREWLRRERLAQVGLLFGPRQNVTTPGGPLFIDSLKEEGGYDM